MTQQLKQLPTAQTMGLASPTETKALSHSLATREGSQVQAQLIAAKRFPRDEKDCLDRILNSCTRESLAAVSQYSYAKGGTDISGPSIKLAQTLAQHWGNIESGWREVERFNDAEGVGVSVIEAYAWDIESNFRVPRIFNVKHWRDTRQGGYALKDEREIYELCANMASRRVRACLLSILPGDIVDTAVDQCDATLKASADTSPEAIAKLIAAFEAFTVTKNQLEEFCQRRLDSITAAQIMRLKKVYVSLRDEMSSPADWFKSKHEAVGEVSTDVLKDVKINSDKDSDPANVKPDLF